MAYSSLAACFKNSACCARKKNPLLTRTRRSVPQWLIRPHSPPSVPIRRARFALAGQFGNGCSRSHSACAIQYSAGQFMQRQSSAYGSAIAVGCSAIGGQFTIAASVHIRRRGFPFGVVSSRSPVSSQSARSVQVRAVGFGIGAVGSQSGRWVPKPACGSGSARARARGSARTYDIARVEVEYDIARIEIARIEIVVVVARGGGARSCRSRNRERSGVIS